MYAVIDIAGKQFRIAQNDKILIPSMKGKAGSTIRFDKVFLLGEGNQISGQSDCHGCECGSHHP
jgi:large subunit ribosomal protein L21